MIVALAGIFDIMLWAYSLANFICSGVLLLALPKRRDVLVRAGTKYLIVAFEMKVGQTIIPSPALEVASVTARQKAMQSDNGLKEPVVRLGLTGRKRGPGSRARS